MGPNVKSIIFLSRYAFLPPRTHRLTFLTRVIHMLLQFGFVRFVDVTHSIPAPATAGSAPASVAYLRAHAAAFSTLGVNPTNGGTLLPGAEEEWNTEALPPGINQQTL